MRLFGFALVGALALGVLSGCGAKPPDCSQPETLALASQIIQNSFKERIQPEIEAITDPDMKPLLSRLSRDYPAALKVQVTEIVSNGYNEGAKKFSCEAKFTVDTATGSRYEARSDYSTQHVQDKDGGFLLTLDKANGFVTSLYQDFTLTYIPQEGAKYKAEQAAAATRALQVQAQASLAAAQPASSAQATPAAPTSSAMVATPDPSAATQQVPASPSPSAPPVTAAAHPSFDCGKASTGAERMICATPELADADSKLADAYKQAMARVGDREALRSQQIAWRKEQRDVCKDTACMTSAYRARLGQLDQAK